MSINLSDFSTVFWYPDRQAHKCGYCKSETGSISYGMWAENLTVEDYQNLIDRGWRRSGKYCYKPLMHQICCPLYTIRCDALNFSLSKSQKKVMKKFNKFVNDGVLTRSDSGGSQDKNQAEENCSSAQFYRHKSESSYGNFAESTVQFVEDCNTDSNSDFCDKNNLNSKQVVDERENNYSEDCVDGPCASAPSIGSRMIAKTIGENTTKTTDSTVNPQTQSSHQPKSGVGADPTKPPCKKAKQLRLERKQQKLLKRGMSLEKLPVKNDQKTLEEFLGEISENSKHKFRLELVNPSRRGSDWDRVKSIEFDLYRRYQMAIHDDPPEKCTVEGFNRFLVNSPLKTSLVRLDDTHHLFETCARLFAKYQMAIHDEPEEECDEEQFVCFLVDSPLKFVRFSRDSDLGYGSFHQLYWLDDKLIAVGVIDILPKCVSAVYFFYDPDYRSLTLGTYGTLREVEFVRSLHDISPTIEFYYMGFYIHSCQKMRYKGKLTPSFLLCPETYNWIPIEKCIPKLEVSTYSRLEENLDSIDGEACSKKDISEIKIFHKGVLMHYTTYKHRVQNRDDVIEVIGQTVGRKCAKKIIFVLA